MSADPRAGRRLKIAHLYPEAMDLYGDTGNVLALRRRCQWRGIAVEIEPVRVGESADLRAVDLIVMGGGQDAAQSHVAGDLARRGPALRELIDEGAAALMVCGGFQLAGTSYETAAGETLEGIGLFDARTVSGEERIIGNVVVEARLCGSGAGPAETPLRLVGFENHSGRTHLGEDARSLGRVLSGGGNVGDGSVDGAVYKNAIGTYLHGPLLPKNPELADHLIIAALAHRRGRFEALEPLDDALEMHAHTVAVDRCENGRSRRLNPGLPRRRVAAVSGALTTR
jgi:lipid II isoglutaminyl synthase (glutamine-hydrolysing)